MQDSISTELKTALELHGFNATVENVGSPAAGIGDWIKYVVDFAGGFVGNIIPFRDGKTGLLAYVPTDREEASFTFPSDRFLSLIAADANIYRTAISKHVSTMSRLLTSLSEQLPPLEASYIFDGISIDLPRSRHTFILPDGYIVRQAGELLTITSADGTIMSEKTFENASTIVRDTPNNPILQGIADRIVRSFSGLHEGPTPTGFVLSISDSGDGLIFLGETTIDNEGPVELFISRQSSMIKQRGRTVIQTQNTSMRMLDLIGCPVVLVGTRFGAPFVKMIRAMR